MISLRGYDRTSQSSSVVHHLYQTCSEGQAGRQEIEKDSVSSPGGQALVGSSGEKEPQFKTTEQNKHIALYREEFHQKNTSEIEMIDYFNPQSGFVYDQTYSRVVGSEGNGHTDSSNDM